MKTSPLSFAAALILAAQPLLAQGIARSAAGASVRPNAPVAAPVSVPSGITTPSSLLAAPSLSPTLPSPSLTPTAAAAPASALAVTPAQAAAAAYGVPVTPAFVSPRVEAPTEGEVLPADATPTRQGAVRGRSALRRSAAAFAAPSTAWNGVASAPSVMGRLRRWAASFMLGLTMLNPAAGIAQNALPLPPPAPAVAVIAQAQAPARVTQAAVLQARDLNDALSRYDASVRVIVLGDVGLGQGELQRLANSLAGKHWTVVLVQDASGLRYTDAEGRAHYGDDAVDFATGQGLYKKEGVLAQTHPKTGERDGAILTIVMQQRILLLRTADAYNSRGLDGQTQFKGNLDQWAVSALRASGDIVGAVENTVKNVTALLEQKIVAESASAAAAVAKARAAADALEQGGAAFRAAHPAAFAAMAWPDAGALRSAAAQADKLAASGRSAEALSVLAAPLSAAQNALARASSFESDFAKAGTALAEARSAVDAADRAAAAFRSEHPRSAGDLARPAVDSWRTALKEASALSATDPARAISQAQSVLAAARAQADAAASFAGGAARIAAAESALEALSGSAYADAAAQDLVTARQELAAAREAYADGSSAYAQRLASAKSAMGQAERLIADADASAARNRMLAWLLIALANVVTLGAAFWLNRRSARFGAKAEELFTQWDTALDKKLEAVIDGLDEKMDTYVGAESGPKARGWVGRSAELSASIRVNAGTAKILLAAAQNIHDQVRALVHPKALSWGWVVNLFWPSRYQAAVRRLQDEPIEFKPEDGVEAVLGAKRTWQEELYGDLTAYAPFKKSFNEVITAFNERSQKAAEELARLEAAVTGHGPKLDAVESALSSAQKAFDALQKAGESDGLFLVPSLGATALPAGRTALERARETVKKDPIGGLDGDGALGRRIGEDAAALASWVKALRGSALPASRAAAAALSGAGIASDWLGKAEEKLSGSAEAAAAKLAEAGADARLAKLRAAGEALASRAADAARIQGELASLRTAGLATVTDSVAAAREKVGAALGLPAEKMLREKGMDPTQRLASAAARADETAAFLGQGDLVKADAALKAGNTLVSEAAGLVAGSLASLAGHAEALAARRAESAGLETLAPQRAAVLDEVKRRFAPSVLSLGAGDASHPSANGTVEDNPAEARAEMDSAAAKTEKAVTAFAAGRLLEAASLLDQADAHQDGARHRLDEILDKKTRLEAAVTANAALLETLDARRTEYDGQVAGDARTMKPTLASYKSALGALEDARKAVKAAKGDPFQAAEALASTVAAFKAVWVSTSNDRDAYAEAGRSLEAARRALEAAGKVARQAADDGVADSPLIKAAYRTLEGLARDLTGAEAGFSAEHGDWNAVDQAADRVAAEAGQTSAALRDELAAAMSAASAITSAGSKVREATNWSGSYGVYISGSPGSSELESARAALSRGDYAGAKRHADAAYSRAASAISEAEAEESRRRRAEEERRRREEEERRRRQREEEERRSRSSGGSGGGGSSWGGSGSGNGRSGW